MRDEKITDAEEASCQYRKYDYRSENYRTLSIITFGTRCPRDGGKVFPLLHIGKNHFLITIYYLRKIVSQLENPQQE